VIVQPYELPAISDAETGYLLDIANTYLHKQLDRADVVWTYSGVRPLYDDGKSDPSSVTRDYVLKLDAGSGGQGAPVLSVYGGKLTTYRKLAEAALEALRPHFPTMPGSWTGREPIAGGALPSRDRDTWQRELVARYPGVPGAVVTDIARRHGALALDVLQDARSGADLGEDFGANLTAREVDYFLAREWAFEPDDILWRRTKCGLGLEGEARERLARYVEAHRC